MMRGDDNEGWKKLAVLGVGPVEVIRKPGGIELTGETE